MTIHFSGAAAACLASNAFEIVGQAQNSGGSYRAFLYLPGAAALMDLSSPAPSGWVLTSAVGISDAGHIAGSGTKNGSPRQWVLYPTPQE